MARTSRIQIVINEPRWELYRSGWGLTRIAGSFQPVYYDSSAKNVGYPNGRYVPGDLDDNLYWDDATGILMLTPSVLRKDFNESATWLPFNLKLADFYKGSGTGPTQWYETTDTESASEPTIISLKRADTTTNMAALEDSASYNHDLQSLSLSTYSMCWALETTATLAINEGFSLSFQPYGIITDSASAYIGVAFGGIWYLQIGMNGEAQLYEMTKAHTGSANNAVWIKRQRFTFASGGLNEDRPCRLTIIPFGNQFINFIFSQQPKRSKAKAASQVGAQEVNFLYEVNRYRDAKDSNLYDLATHQFVKVPSAKVQISMRRKAKAYSFSFSRVRYELATYVVPVGPEMLPGPMPELTTVDINIYTVGFNPVDSGSSVTYVNERNNTWTPATDYQVVPLIAIHPSTNQIYTPEVWCLEATFKTVTRKAESGNEYDISALVSQLSWEENAVGDVSRLVCKCNRTTDARNFFKIDGSVIVRIDGENVWEGRIATYQPSMEGAVGAVTNPDSDYDESTNPLQSTMVLQDQLEAVDDWDRFNSESAAWFPSYRNHTIGTLIDASLKRCGIYTGETQIAAELYTIPLDDWTNDMARRSPKDFKTIADDGSFGDLMRDALHSHALQARTGAAIMRTRNKTRAFLVDAYNPSKPPKTVFYLSASALPEEIKDKPDTDRWDGLNGYRWFKIFGSNPTPLDGTMRAPAFNTLIGHAATNNATPADAFAAFIDPHYKSVLDKDYVDYQGYRKTKTLGPNELANCATQNELERRMRKVYDEEMQGLRSFEWTGEWQFIADDIPATSTTPLIHDIVLRCLRDVWIIGKAPWSIPEADIKAGDNVSFGAWRITTIKPHITADYADDGKDELGGDATRFAQDLAFTQTANYSAEYVGVAKSDLYPMFTDILPPYGLPTT